MKHLVISFLLYSISPVSAQIAERYNIVITELFPDPTPAIGLPGTEFIELKNVSSSPFNLRNWKISDGSSTVSINVDFNLQPDSFVIICPESARLAYASFGTTIGVSSFPSINNDQDTIILNSPENKTIHAVAFEQSWYQNAVKSGGGWTLEMKDPSKPCIGYDNWTASIDHKGGTPGKKNSVDEKIIDDETPLIIAAFFVDSTTFAVVFDEPLDSASSTVPLKYTIDNSIGSPFNVSPLSPLFQTILIKLNTSLQAGATYELTVKDLGDCSGNVMSNPAAIKLGIPVSAEPLSVVINEILFNPKPGGADYIELYNRGTEVLEASKLYIANRNFAGNISAPNKISEFPRLIFPEEYIVITEDRVSIGLDYHVKDPAALLQISKMPAYPDDKGTTVILNEKGIIIDELYYDEKWHFALINNREGVALERINFGQLTQNDANWHSAASDAGYGTPGYINSQYRTQQHVQGEISFTPEIFSPDNDGFNDVLTISYQFAEPGYVFNLTIFDASGRAVRYLVQNGLCGTNGFYRWDGLDEKNQKLNPGIYVVSTELFNLQGKTKKFKNTVVLARKLDP